jgi:hypothetical protein
VKHLNADGSESNPGRDDWKRGYDDSSSSGLICLTCFALVPSMVNYAQKHREWHERSGS